MASTKDDTASLMEMLPEDLQVLIKMKVVEHLHNGMWSAWRYDQETRKLDVELGKLYSASDMDEQIKIILLIVDLRVVDALELRRFYIVHYSPLQMGSHAVQVPEQIDMELFKSLVDFIDRNKLVELIVDDQSTEYLSD